MLTDSLKTVCKSKSLTTDEISQTEVLWVISSQKLLAGKTKQLNNTLGMYIDENHLIRCKGRLNLTNLTYNQKNPILLPGNCDIYSDDSSSPDEDVTW